MPIILSRYFGVKGESSIPVQRASPLNRDCHLDNHIKVQMTRRSIAARIRATVTDFNRYAVGKGKFTLAVDTWPNNSAPVFHQRF